MFLCKVCTYINIYYHNTIYKFDRSWLSSNVLYKVFFGYATNYFKINKDVTNASRQEHILIAFTFNKAINRLQTIL